MEPDDSWLLDMLLYARRARAHADGLIREQFLQDAQAQDAVTYAVMIVVEAAAQVSDSRRMEIPGLPWRKIVGMRNRLVHHYFDVDLEILWDVVQIDLPEVIATVELFALDRGMPLPKSD